jgi:hypothetical protein
VGLLRDFAYLRKMAYGWLADCILPEADEAVDRKEGVPAMGVTVYEMALAVRDLWGTDLGRSDRSLGAGVQRH